MNKKILLTGVNGQVGHALLEVFGVKTHNFEIVPVDRSQMDLTNADSIRQVIQQVQPSIIINPAAYTAVDKAESEPDFAFAINATAPRIMAEEAVKLNATLIHFSTDYVYDGSKPDAYLEADLTQPLSVYGKSKLAGENAIRAVDGSHLIFRTSWVYGAYGKNFLRTILRLANERESLNIVEDQTGAPTSSHTIAEAIMQVIQNKTQQNGVYHLVNSGKTSWYEFATAIVEDFNQLQSESGRAPLLAQTIRPIRTEEYPTPAKRPANSLLDMHKLVQDFGIQTPHWRDSLQRELKIIATIEG